MKQLSTLLCACRFFIFLLFFVHFSKLSDGQAPAVTIKAGIPTGNTACLGVAYGNGIYVAVFDKGKVFTSADGSDWTKVTNPNLPGGYGYRIAYGAGIFVITMDNGKISSSTDGITWTARTSGTSNNLGFVNFLQGAFYVTGDNNTLLKSTDGIAWNAINFGVGTNGYLINITWGNGYFIVASRNTSGMALGVYRSATGASNTWSYQAISYDLVNRVQYLKDKFFIFTSGTTVYTSADGASWTNSTSSLTLTLPNSTVQNIGTPNQAFHGIYDGTKVYLYGSTQYYQSQGSYGSISSSTNGTSFTLQPRTVYIVCQGAEYLNSKYFQWGNEGLVISDDGVNYRYLSGNYYAVASSGSGNYIGAGSVSSAGVVWKSGDFSTWTDHSPSSLSPLYGLAWNGAEYLAVGDRSVAKSTDNGNTWSQIATPSKTYMSLAYGAGKYVAVGYDADTYAAEIGYSATGTSWTVANSANNWYFRVKYVNNAFFAFGYDNDTYTGIVMYSADGLAWSDITPSLAFTTYYYNDIVYDGSKYVLMGTEADYSFFSVTSTTPATPASWANKSVVSGVPGGVTIGGTWGDGAFAYSNGKFAGSVVDATTGEAYLLYSSDGINWTAAATGETGSMAGVVTEASSFKMTGSGNLMITADFSLVTLPVRLTSFTGSLVNDEAVLQWKTAQEHNSSYFRLQYSTDQSNWSDIASMKAAGESNTEKQYRYVHTQPAPGDNYYRLVQVDLDGKEQISNIVRIKAARLATANLYPNPASENIIIELPASSASSIIIYDANGQQVFRNNFLSKTIRISLKSLPGGAYKAMIVQGEKQFVKAFIHR
ncbi:MAG: T9SS type A sorting domain-containing protein [Chitinophagaceae bacterium]